MKRLILLLILIPNLAWATTYYIDPTCATPGNGTSGTCASGATDPFDQWSDVTWTAGNSYLQKRGTTAREQITVVTSGALGNIITLGAYGTGANPILNGADLVTGWSQYLATNIYSATCTWTAPQVFEDEVKLTYITWDTNIATTAAAMSAGTWTLDDPNNLLYVWATNDADPDTHSMEVTKRDFGIYGWRADYITIQNVYVRNAQTGIFDLGGSDWIVENCTSSYNYQHGIRINGQDSFPTDNTIVQDCTVSYNAYAGIVGYYNGTNVILRRNTVHHNVWRVGSTSGGIKINDPTFDSCIIENNTVYANGPTTLTQGEGSGIWVDSTGGGNIVRYNLVYNNGDYGIYLEAESLGNEVYYNVVHSHVSDVNAYAGTGIYLQRQAKENKIYNNVSYGNRIGIGVVGDVPAAADSCENNIIKNNIAFENTVRQLTAWYGGENDGTNGSGNVYTYNCFGPEASNFIEWGAGTYKSTYDAWETSYGGTTYSVEADPVFVSVVTPDFHLQLLSPCKDKGTNVGLTQDYAGRHVPSGIAPEMGAYEFMGMSQDKILPGGFNIY